MSSSSGSEDGAHHRENTFCSAFSRHTHSSSIDPTRSPTRHRSHSLVGDATPLFPGLARNAEGELPLRDGQVPAEYFAGTRRRGRCVEWNEGEGQEEGKGTVVDEEWGERRMLSVSSDQLHALDLRNARLYPGEQVEYRLAVIGEDLFAEEVTGLYGTPCGSPDSLALSGVDLDISPPSVNAEPEPEPEPVPDVEQPSRLRSRTCLRLNFLRGELRRYRQTSAARAPATATEEAGLAEHDDAATGNGEALTSAPLNPLAQSYRAVSSIKAPSAAAAAASQQVPGGFKGSAAPKAELCWTYALFGRCADGERCVKAHGLLEVKPSTAEMRPQVRPARPLLAPFDVLPPSAIASIPVFSIGPTPPPRSRDAPNAPVPIVRLSPPSRSRAFKPISHGSSPALATHSTPTVRIPLSMSSRNRAAVTVTVKVSVEQHKNKRRRVSSSKDAMGPTSTPTAG